MTVGKIIRHAPNGREYPEVFSVSDRHHLAALELHAEHGPHAMAMFGRVGYQFIAADERLLAPPAIAPPSG